VIVDLFLVKKILRHSTSQYLAKFVPSLQTGLLIALGMWVVQTILPTNFNPPLKLAMELATGLIGFVFLRPEILVAPVQVFIPNRILN
jgi:hypothetical protein